MMLAQGGMRRMKVGCMTNLLEKKVGCMTNLLEKKVGCKKN